MQRFRRTALALALAAAGLGCANASTSGLVISQVYGGGQSGGATYKRDYVEIFNAGNSSQSLSGMSLQYGSATGNFGSGIVSLPNVAIAPGKYYLVAVSGAGSAGADVTGFDLESTSISMQASNAKIALATGTTSLGCGGPTACNATQAARLVDYVAYGSSSGAEGAAAVAALSVTTSAERKNGGCTDTDNNGADFNVGSPTLRNSATAANLCSGGGNAAIVPNCPASVSVSAGTSVQINVSATDTDSIVNAITLANPVAGITLGTVTPAIADGGTASAALSVADTLSAGSYTAQLQFANNESQTASCSVTVNVSGAAVTPIFQIQGSGSTSPLLGQTVTTKGVVTKINSNGYFIQDSVGDGNPATSDGIFVFTSSAPAGVAVGDLVQLTATVAEYNTGAAGNALTAAHTVTELTDPGDLSVLGTGSITPTVIDFPELNEDDLERVEGMLVRINGTLTASQNYFLGRYGQITLAAGGRLLKPTNLHRPGSVAALGLAADNARRRIILDDGSGAQNPNPTPFLAADNTQRAGDTLDGLTGVIDYGLATADNTGLADYRIHPVGAVNFTRSNPRTTAPAAVGGNVKVASFNVLNYFTTIDQSGASCAPSGTRSDCRGADSAAEFTRQQAKIVEAVAAIDADVIGLMEIQNNGNTAVQNLVNALNARVGAGTYATIGLPGGAGTGTDAIRVAMVYKPGKLTLSGSATSDTASIHNRPPLAQSFTAANGEKFSVVVNHFKSKGCDGASGADADQGDGQGCFNDRRLRQAQALRAFITGIQASSGDPDVIVIGDLNAYGAEDPVYNLTSNGYTDLLATLGAAGEYSYVFDGESGYLDHALTTASLASQATGAAHWHINADEPFVIDYNLEFKQPACATCGPDYYTATPYRSSDHDPVIVGLNLVKRFGGTAGRDTIVGSAGDDVITGGEGADTLTGNGGRDVFVYASQRDGTDTVTDFVPGTDRLDLGGLLAELGISASQALSGGYIALVDTAAGLSVRVDADGSAGAGGVRPLVTLRGVTASQIVAARDLGL
ncbi:MAG: ExeM/NucH family extracellular endonuclease [Aquabacterium sp.]|nr:MAG: ExeM/NucH family extracellular endonuclease [Aquabacterium sp.]